MELSRESYDYNRTQLQNELMFWEDDFANCVTHEEMEYAKKKIAELSKKLDILNAGMHP